MMLGALKVSAFVDTANLLPGSVIQRCAQDNINTKAIKTNRYLNRGNDLIRPKATQNYQPGRQKESG